MPIRLIHIFYAVTDNIIDDLLHLLRIRDDHGIGRYQIRIVQLDTPLLQIQSDFFHTVAEIIRHVDPVEIVRDPVIINSGISGQLVDQTIHINGFIVDGLDVFIHLLRRICHTVHDSFHITLNGCDRGLQIMGNIADQLFVLLLMLGVLFRGFLQPQTHILIIAVEITDLTLGIRLQNIIKVAFLDLAHCYVQFIDRFKYALVDPLGQHQAREDQDHDDRHEHVDQQMSRDQRIDLRYNKDTARCSIPESEINLFYILLQFIVEISAVIRQILFTVGRQFFKNLLCGIFIARIV